MVPLNGLQTPILVKNQDKIKQNNGQGSSQAFNTKNDKNNYL